MVGHHELCLTLTFPITTPGGTVLTNTFFAEAITPDCTEANNRRQFETLVSGRTYLPLIYRQYEP